MFKVRFVVPFLVCILSISAHSGKKLSYHAKDSNVKVRKITARGIYLGHGVLAPLNVVTGITDNALEHWWVEIETENVNEWYILQFGGKSTQGDKKNIELVRCDSREEVENRGTFGDSDKTVFYINSFRPDTPRPTTNQDITIPPQFYHDPLTYIHIVNASRNRTRTIKMEEIYQWASSQNDSYDLFSNNCQDLVNNFFKNFNGTKASSPRQTTEIALELVDVAEPFITTPLMILGTCNIF